MRNLLICLTSISTPAFSSICDNLQIAHKFPECRAFKIPGSHSTGLPDLSINRPNRSGGLIPIPPRLPLLSQKDGLRTGLLLKSGVEGTIYHAMGLQKNDVITQINGHKLSQIKMDSDRFLERNDRFKEVELKIFRPVSQGGV